MDTKAIKEFVDRSWSHEILPTLEEYVRIPAKSPDFDAEWERNGYIEKAALFAFEWCKAHPVEGMQLSLHRLPGRTPLLFIDIPATLSDWDPQHCVLLYGHLDKQPEFSGWRPGLGPWEPVIEDDKLYGRGGADDGYAVFASLTAIRALQAQGIPHARCVLVIELCEESGSFDLPYHFDELVDRIGEPELVICLDAECGNYDQFWCTTSLRGNLVGILRVDVMTEGVHSGGSGGIVPSSLRILRSLLDRLEDPVSGRIRVGALDVTIPQERQLQASRAGAILRELVAKRFPLLPGVMAQDNDPVQLILNNTWRACMEVTGAEGFPEPRAAGNVLRPWSAFKLSLRLAPTTSAERAAQAVKETLESQPPNGAKVTFTVNSAMSGWDAPTIAPWLERSMQLASREFFGAEALYMGTGGTIPFMGMLGRRFPNAQFLVTGLLGPHSNAHGPNEFLHIPTAKRLTACVSRIIADHVHASG